MKIFRYAIYIVLFIFLILSFWMVFHQNFRIFQNDKAPDAFMTQAHIIRLNKFGKKHYELMSPKVQHYTKDDQTFSQKPFVIVYGENNESPWHINGDKSHSIHGDQKIILTGHVKIKQLPGINSNNVTITTSQLTWYPRRSFAQTDRPVTITQLNSQVHAIGMTADFKKDWIKLLSQAKGFYQSEDNSQSKTKSN